MQAIGPAAENARRPEVLSRKRGTASRWRLEVGIGSSPLKGCEGNCGPGEK